MKGVVERFVGAPAVFQELKHKPGRRLTLRARGPEGSVIVKLYHSGRVSAVAERVASLGEGPAEPEVPQVLAVDPAERLLVLSDVSGKPLRKAVLAGAEDECRRAGAALAAWHEAWGGRRPPALREHTIEREIAALIDRAAIASREIGVGVGAALRKLHDGWLPVTVVHRDLYEEQILLGERVGLIDLDDAALGPPELDVGNLLAHLDLLELPGNADVQVGREALLEGYAERAALDPELLERCRTLARLRLACIHDEPRLASGAELAVSLGA